MKAEYFEIYRTIGLRISYYRKLKGLTQEQLAEMIDKSTSFLGPVEATNIDKSISLDTFFIFTKLFMFLYINFLLMTKIKTLMYYQKYISFFLIFTFCRKDYFRIQKVHDFNTNLKLS